MKDKLWMQLTYVALWGSIPLYLSLTMNKCTDEPIQRD